MAPGSGSLSSLRELNRLRIVDFLRINGTASRAELARRTGLARSTVSTLVSDLQRRGIVVEQPGQFAGEGSRADPPPFSSSTPRRARPSASTSTTTGCASRCRTCRASSWPRPALRRRPRRLRRARPRRRPRRTAAGRGRHRPRPRARTGMALAGPIDQERAALHNSTVLPGWADVDAGAELEQRLGTTVYVDNDANLGALAEVTLGAGRRALRRLRPDGVGRRAGSWSTAAPTAAPRHRRRDRPRGRRSAGPLCRCGNRGCLETVARRGAAGACEREPRA